MFEMTLLAERNDTDFPSTCTQYENRQLQLADHCSLFFKMLLNVKQEIPPNKLRKNKNMILLFSKNMIILKTVLEWFQHNLTYQLNLSCSKTCLKLIEDASPQKGKGRKLNIPDSSEFPLFLPAATRIQWIKHGKAQNVICTENVSVKNNVSKLPVSVAILGFLLSVLQLQLPTP